MLEVWSWHLELWKWHVKLTRESFGSESLTVSSSSSYQLDFRSSFCGNNVHSAAFMTVTCSTVAQGTAMSQLLCKRAAFQSSCFSKFYTFHFFEKGEPWVDVFIYFLYIAGNPRQPFWVILSAAPACWKQAAPVLRGALVFMPSVFRPDFQPLDLKSYKQGIE